MRIIRHQKMVFETKGEGKPLRMVGILEIELKKDPNNGVPLIFGENIERCPECGECLSFAYDYYFCRNPECSYNKNNLGS